VEGKNKMADTTREFYLGIDLGTTNSSIAWGSVGKNGIFRPRMVDMQLPMADGSWETKQLLPSFFYLTKDQNDHEVGYKAKHMLKTQPGRVIRSIKTKMGQDWKKTIDEKDFTPEDISSYILKQLLSGIKRTFRTTINDIVVTVPASFDSEMRSATLEAARKAGIKVKNDNGSPRNILLDEPRACLYDFVNRQKQGEIPDHIIDFSTKKRILVYDLGGGTLDVSLHDVNFKSPEHPLVNIEDIAISRYTDIGGDNFDEKLTDYLFQRYCKENSLKLQDYSDIEIEFAKMSLFYYVESFKRMITNDALRREEMFEDYDPEDVRQSIMAGYLLEQHPLSIELSLKEYEEIMEEFLAKDIKYPTTSNIGERIGEKNLISPILDVLNKAFKKLNEIVKPDLILLSGGMTKLPMVRKRLSAFFGMEPQTIPDPDKAVSRGAAIYHYYLHQGYRPTAILAESIILEMKGHKMKELVPSGVSLPYDNEFDFNIGGKEYVDIPLYRTDSLHPLAQPRFSLSKLYPSKTKIKAKINVNLLKVMEFQAWVKDFPSDKIIITIDFNKSTKQKKNGVEVKQRIEPSVEEKIEESRQFVKEKESDSRVVQYNELVEFFDSIPYTNKPNYAKLTEVEIVNSRNIDRVVRGLLKIQRKTHHKIREKIILLLGDIVSEPRVHENYPNVIYGVNQNMVRYVDMVQNLDNPNSKEINISVRYAIETIGKTKTVDLQRNVITSLISWVKEPIFHKIRSAILTSLGKMPADNEILAFLVEFISKPQKKNTLIPSLWALGKQGSRDLTNPIIIDYMGNVHETILQKMDSTVDFEIIQYISYTLLEICKINPNHPENCVSKDARAGVIQRMESKLISLEKPFKKQKFSHLDQKLKDWGRFLSTQKWINLTIQALKGLEFSDEDIELLDGFRSK
jgi:molecular chaperone DnaK (HSP70)